MTITEPAKRRDHDDYAVTQRVLREIAYERTAQDTKWGEQNHPDVDQVLMLRPGGCDPYRMAEEYEIASASRARRACQSAAKAGTVTWPHILIEEVAEAIEQATIGNEVGLRAELIQIAAVAVAWAEAIDRRSAAGASA